MRMWIIAIYCRTYTKQFLVYYIPDQIGIWKSWFWRSGKPGYPQWGIQGRGPGGGRPHLFLDQHETTPPYLTFWMTGLPPPPLIWRSGSAFDPDKNLWRPNHNTQLTAWIVRQLYGVVSKISNPAGGDRPEYSHHRTAPWACCPSI